MAPDLPATADVIIIGGGIVGCSVAYHLAHSGVPRVLLLESRQLTCGTTWHAAGLVGQLRSTRRLTELALYGIRLYESLEDETGQATGFKRNGSISIATSDERMEELARGASMARSLGIEALPLSSTDIGALFPLVNTIPAICVAAFTSRQTGRSIRSIRRWHLPGVRGRLQCPTTRLQQRCRQTTG
jgi:4-methylaminobutanoate oxidase (formaldehyde-forming)